MEIRVFLSCCPQAASSSHEHCPVGDECSQITLSGGVANFSPRCWLSLPLDLVLFINKIAACIMDHVSYTIWIDNRLCSNFWVLLFSSFNQRPFKMRTLPRVFLCIRVSNIIYFQGWRLDWRVKMLVGTMSFWTIFFCNWCPYHLPMTEELLDPGKGIKGINRRGTKFFAF